MAGTDDIARAERLAAKLRENLRRRKAQARALGSSEAEEAPADGESPADLPPPLPKSGPSR